MIYFKKRKKYIFFYLFIFKKHSVTAHASLTDGVEEVFAAIGEPVTLFCGGKYSSVTEERKVKWTENKHRLTGDMASQNGRPRVSEAFPSLVIGKVSALHAGEYQCSEFSTPERVINKIWLYTLDGERRKNIMPKLCTLYISLDCRTCLPVFTQLLQSVGVEEGVTSR